MTNIHCQTVTPEQVYPVRHKVLRPGRPFETAKFDGDLNKDTIHFGIFIDEELVGVCSLYPRPLPDNYQAKVPGVGLINHSKTCTNTWQLRGMATLAEHQGKGLGSQLLQYVASEVHKLTPNPTIWANARVAALNLYLRNGYEVSSEEFEVPLIGPHFLVVRSNS
jgi:GNAT superfamily N-acetyltransferase